MCSLSAAYLNNSDPIVDPVLSSSQAVNQVSWTTTFSNVPSPKAMSADCLTGILKPLGTTSPDLYVILRTLLISPTVMLLALVLVKSTSDSASLESADSRSLSCQGMSKSLMSCGLLIPLNSE